MTTNDDKSKESSLRQNSSRIGKYLSKYLEGFLFDEFTDAYIDRQQLNLSFMRGVPAPFRKQTEASSDVQIPHGDLTGQKTSYMKQDGFLVEELCINMAWIIGISPKFPHAQAYTTFMVLFYGDKAIDFLIGIAKKSAELKEFDASCVFYRAALCIEPENLTAMFEYAHVCREIYLSLDDNKQIGDYKAEAFHYFELTTVLHPEFADSHYYLGYAYLNLGLYKKAQLTWKRYLKLSSQDDKHEEIKDRISRLTAPVEIEKGCNSVLAGRTDEGISMLESHTNDKYSRWWPLYYYLGIAYKAKNERIESEKMFKKALDLNPSHIESMEELADLYKASEDFILEKKYRNKAALVRES